MSLFAETHTALTVGTVRLIIIKKSRLCFSLVLLPTQNFQAAYRRPHDRQFASF